MKANINGRNHEEKNMHPIITNRINDALESARCVDPQAKLTALREGGWKIELICNVNGAFVDFYGNDGRLTAHLHNG